MDTVKKFLVAAIGLVVTLVIVGTGIGIYRSTKPIADFATEGVNTLAGEMTSKYYKYNGKVMTGAELTKVFGTDGELNGETHIGEASPWSANVSYTLTVNWDSKTNTLKNITIKKLNQ